VERTMKSWSSGFGGVMLDFAFPPRRVALSESRA
jgi:hypothetical protein